MKTDKLFPPPPQFNQPPLRCDDIPPARQRALDRLSQFAGVAESLVGSLAGFSQELTEKTKGSEPGPPPGFPATSRGFALHVFRDSPFADEIEALLSRSKIHVTQNDEVDAPHLMLIDVRRHWGVLGPIRGDIALFADGSVSVVTRPLCMGCQHFEGVSLLTDAEPRIEKRTHWTSTVRWLLRLVDESEDDPQIAPIGQIAETTRSDGDPSGSVSSAKSADAAPSAKHKRKIAGIG